MTSRTNDPGIGPGPAIRKYLQCSRESCVIFRGLIRRRRHGQETPQDDLLMKAVFRMLLHYIEAVDVALARGEESYTPEVWASITTAWDQLEAAGHEYAKLKKRR